MCVGVQEANFSRETELDVSMISFDRAFQATLKSLHLLGRIKSSKNDLIDEI